MLSDEVRRSSNEKSAPVQRRNATASPALDAAAEASEMTGDATVDEAESADLIRVISELADPRSALLMQRDEQS